MRSNIRQSYFVNLKIVPRQTNLWVTDSVARPGRIGPRSRRTRCRMVGFAFFRSQLPSEPDFVAKELTPFFASDPATPSNQQTGRFFERTRIVQETIS